ncbi:MAG: hypothetical protein ABIT96_02135 [Ferruginibacter sp.]
MKPNFLLFIFLTIAAASCTSAYRSGQTPDDVYFSPVRIVDESDDHDDDKKEDQVNNDREEQQIRMSTRDRRWRDWEGDYDYRYDPYRYGYGYGYYYNPYYSKYPVYISGNTISNPKSTLPRQTNLSTYSQAGSATTVYNSKTGSPVVNANRRYSSRDTRNNGGFIRNVILPAIGTSTRTSSGNNSSSSGNNTRTYEPSSSSSSTRGSSGSSSSESKPVSRPGRGN